MNRVGKNAVANLIGNSWRLLMSLLFVPWYVQILGAESYGLVGFFLLLYTCMAMLDLGLTPTMSREMARYRAGKHSAPAFRELFNTVECVCFGIAALVVLVGALTTDWVADAWLQPEELSSETVGRALLLLYLVLALRWLIAYYAACFNGLQKQVALNVVTVVFATAQGPGVILILLTVSATIEAYFVTQLALTFLHVLTLRLLLVRWIPTAKEVARFAAGSLRKVWRFAGGVYLISVLALVMTQIDKILLSRLLSLESFAYFSVAVTVAAGLKPFISALCSAFYPQLTTLYERDEKSQMAELFQLLAHWMTVLVLPLALTVSLFAEPIILFWSNDPAFARPVAAILSVYILGSAINAVMNPIAFLQLACGWTRLGVIANLSGIVVMVPLTLYVIPEYGLKAAPLLWLGLHLSYFLLVAPLTFRRVLKGQARRWYVSAILLPGVAAFCVVFGASQLLGDVSHYGRLWGVLLLALVFGFSMLAAVIASDRLRPKLFRLLR